VVKFRLHRHGSPEPPYQGTDVGKSNSLSRLVLCTGPAEKVKNPLMVPGIDAAAVVGDLENRKAQPGPAPHGDLAGNSRLEVFQGVIDQVRENLLQREAVADDFGQWFDADIGLGLGGLVGDRGNDASINSRVSICTGSN